jgi:hypothetical protein
MRGRTGCSSFTRRLARASGLSLQHDARRAVLHFADDAGGRITRCNDGGAQLSRTGSLPTKRATGAIAAAAAQRPAQLHDPKIENKETRPPPRYNEGTLIEAMQNAWRFVDDEVLRERLKEASIWPRRSCFRTTTFSAASMP